MKTIFAAALAASTFLAAPAFAQTFTSDLDDWKDLAGSFLEDSSYGTEYDTVSSVALYHGPTLSLDTPSSIRTIGSGWSTWSGGYTGQVLFPGTDSITVSLSPTTSNFGFFAEPNNFSKYFIKLTLDDGSSLSRKVDGSGGAKFFGWNGGGVTSFTITSATGSGGFAFGDFFYTGTGVPEPATWGLMILGFGAIGGVMRRRSAAKVSYAI